MNTNLTLGSCCLLLCLCMASMGMEQVSQCTALYTRAFFGSTYLQSYQGSESLLQIRFNTKSKCSYSFIVVSTQDYVRKVYCSSQLLRFVNSSPQPYETYIHSCLIPMIRHQGVISYTPYATTLPFDLPIMSDNIYKIYLPTESKLKLVVLGDWGYVKVRPYDALRGSLQRLLNNADREQIHGLINTGDYAYDLYSNNGQTYQEFMEMFQQVSPYWPMIPITGNHETWSAECVRIFKATFQVYNEILMSKNYIQVYKFPTANIMAFDPYYPYYSQSTRWLYNRQLREMENELAMMTTDIDTKMMISVSHYPLICSYVDQHCRDTLTNLTQAFQLFDHYQNDLYIGAHMHIYERFKPYKNNSFQMGERTPYNRGRLVSVVEGIAGTDYGIDTEDPTLILDSSEKLIHDRTGYGVMHIYKEDNGPMLNYQHYRAIETDPSDEFMITSVWKQH